MKEKWTTYNFCQSISNIQWYTRIGAFFFKEHPIRLFSACKPTLNSEFSKQKSHHMKKKNFFIMDQYTTNTLWCIATGPKEHLFWLFSACKSHASTIHTKLLWKLIFLMMCQYTPNILQYTKTGASYQRALLLAIFSIKSYQWS